ncbi:Uncharacterized protein BP5553_07385 [Venustampulla echinocandica]|uniref:Uncharacterized protein n=1 Tax=Venustampulla echinocandica TaxID=2656787 RepID=A0A370TJB0_9HELO|nr:Uncharacterized protein BP5553_07385 [Venustampulla echinocandica]RDL35454.1 Uncharacterized protein BP5553_07385 [Venustampulla echinocandica]
MSLRINKPTNPKERDADVARKLQFYGILTAFQNGKVPSNEQIDIALNSFLASKPLSAPSKKLSAEGQALVKDARDVVEQAKYLLLSKNQGNLLQDFIWQTHMIEGGNATGVKAPVGKDTREQHGNEALEGLRTLGTLMISNGQFRKLLNDATVLIRDIAGDAATKAATKVNPSEEQLAQIDRPADDNTWHDAPNMSKGDLKNQVKSQFNKQTPLNKDDIRDAAGNAAQSAHPQGSRDPADAAAQAAWHHQQGESSGVDARAGVRSGTATLRQNASENVPDETKDRGREYKDRTKGYLESKMPEERRQQTIWRLKKMVIEVQGHPDYQQAINTLLNLAETYAGHANTIGEQSTGAVKGAHSDSALKTAEYDLKTLIERFANNTSSDDIVDALNTIYRDADRDPELKNWFKQMDSYIRKCLQQQGFIMDDRANDEWNALYDRGNFLLRDRYRNHTDRIVEEMRFFVDQFDQDQQNKRFGQSMQRLFHNLGNDKNGRATFKPHLVKDLCDVILPGIFESIRYVPIPRIEYSDPMIDAVIENLIIESDNLMPNIFEVTNDNYFRWGRKNLANKNYNSVTLFASGVQMDLRDVSYYIKRKQGTPKLSDLGVADIFLGGTGFSVKIGMSTAEKKDRENFFKINKVDVELKDLKIKLKQSKHKLLFALFKPLLLRVMRPALQKALEKVIKEKAHELDSLAWQVKQEADRALNEVKEDPKSAPNVYQRYFNAIQKQVLQGKQKAEAATADKKVNMAMTQKDSIFPDLKLPKGISTKATEYKELALKGDSWESPVFKIGSASPSTNIPKAVKPKRKHHPVNRGGVRGPQNVGGSRDSAVTGVDGAPIGDAPTGAVPIGGTAIGTNGLPTGGKYQTPVAAGFSSQVDEAFGKEQGSVAAGSIPITTVNGSVHL